MRSIAPLLLLCACTSLTPDQTDQLATHQRNAQFYYEGNKLSQALDQANRGLELDPDDYKLNAIKGAVLLRGSGNDYKLLDQATALLAEVYDWRSPRYHEPFLLLPYALAEQKQGLRRLGEAIRIEDRAARAVEPELQSGLKQEAEQMRTAARQRLLLADEVLSYLVERGELLRVVYNHRMQIAMQLDNDAEFKEMSKAYFAQCRLDQKATKEAIERTTTPQFEQEKLREYRDLLDEEADVRALVSDWHFRRGNFDESLAHINRVLEIDPQRISDYYNRGRVLEAKNDIEAAKADFRLFLGASSLPATSEKKIFAAEVLKR